MAGCPDLRILLKNNVANQTGAEHFPKTFQNRSLVPLSVNLHQSHIADDIFVTSCGLDCQCIRCGFVRKKRVACVAFLIREIVEGTFAVFGTQSDIFNLHVTLTDL